MPIPIIDASQALKASPEKTEDALLKVREDISLALQLSKAVATDREKLSEGVDARLVSVSVFNRRTHYTVSPD